MNIIIVNHYREKINIDYETLIRFVVDEAVHFVQCPYECEVNVSIVDLDTMRRLNFEYRKIEAATDVLSFPGIEYEAPGNFGSLDCNIFNFNPDSGELLLGDIVLCYDKVLSQAKEYGHSIKRELSFLVAHSMLHLFGYDHTDERESRIMEDKQEQILKNLGIER